MDDALRLGARTSALSFLLGTAAVLAGSVLLLVMFDPRAQAYWVDRWTELLISFEQLGSFLRNLLPR